MKQLKTGLSLIVLFFLVSNCAIFKPTAQPPLTEKLPVVDREFRAAWVATVANIDWPSEPGLTTEQQKNEAIAILDTAVALHLNALIFQVRPQCDALYPSQLEPWSYYLSGEQGKAPEPYYDPLEFWVEEAHNRGIELHCWFNPYRAHHPKGGPISDHSLVNTKPNLVKALESGYHWLDPGNPKTKEHSHNVVMDVLRRYDIDGVHFDDYFYPYGNGDFPDDESWSLYQSTGGKLSRDDWRRENVNSFIKNLYEAIKKEKPHVKFGISPFGLYRPGFPRSIKGFDQYKVLYADARLWFNEGWIDYWTPQLYWPINQIPQSFPVLLGWWTNENLKGRHLWPGMFTTKFNDEKGTDEIINQIMIERGFVPEKAGHVHFSMKALLHNFAGINGHLKSGPYKNPALVPASPWLDDQKPAEPQLVVEAEGDSLIVSWTHDFPDDVFRWVFYYKYSGSWRYKVLNRGEKNIKLALKQIQQKPALAKGANGGANHISEFLEKIALVAVDRTGNESKAVIQRIK